MNFLKKMIVILISIFMHTVESGKLQPTNTFVLKLPDEMPLLQAIRVVIYNMGCRIKFSQEFQRDITNTKTVEVVDSCELNIYDLEAFKTLLNQLFASSAALQTPDIFIQFTGSINSKISVNEDYQLYCEEIGVELNKDGEIYYKKIDDIAVKGIVAADQIIITYLNMIRNNFLDIIPDLSIVFIITHNNRRYDEHLKIAFEDQLIMLYDIEGLVIGYIPEVKL